MTSPRVRARGFRGGAYRERFRHVLTRRSLAAGPAALFSPHGSLNIEGVCVTSLVFSRPGYFEPSKQKRGEDGQAATATAGQSCCSLYSLPYIDGKVAHVCQQGRPHEVKSRHLSLIIHACTHSLLLHSETGNNQTVVVLISQMRRKKTLEEESSSSGSRKESPWGDK